MRFRGTKIVLDTNIFINPDSRYFFGRSAEEALNTFLDMLDKKKKIRAYMPPSIYEELLNFIDREKISEKISLISKKPPSKYETPVPALLLYEFIEEMRVRINKGLRIAEKYSRRTSRELKEEDIIKNIRNEYRTALREGILDSKEDFDLILLSKEISAFLATSDHGLIKWAHKLGIVCISAQDIKNMLSRE